MPDIDVHAILNNQVIKVLFCHADGLVGLRLNNFRFKS